MLQEALGIFAFDGLIQNVDRRRENPNLMARGERLCVIDHECAFSFLSSLSSSEEPWTMGPGDYMERHALRLSLQGNALDWEGCRNGLRVLTKSFFEDVRAVLPVEWNGTQDLLAIENHVAVVLENGRAFETQLQRKIA